MMIYKDRLARYVTCVCFYRPLNSRNTWMHDCRCSIRVPCDSGGLIQKIVWQSVLFDIICIKFMISDHMNLCSCLYLMLLFVFFSFGKSRLYIQWALTRYWEVRTSSKNFENISWTSLPSVHDLTPLILLFTSTV